MKTTPRFVAWFLAALPGWAFLIAALFALFLVATDEWRPLTNASLKIDPPKLWGPLFGQQYFAYRIKQIERLRPNVIMFGSSRGGQFRAAMFPGTKFYNASLGATSIGGSVALLKEVVRIHRPKLLILPIDTWWFNPKWSDGCTMACMAMSMSTSPWCVICSRTRPSTATSMPLLSIVLWLRNARKYLRHSGIT